MKRTAISRKNPTRGGFTLIEVIVVVIIIGVLIGVTIGGIFGYIRDAKRNKAIYVANELETALNIKLGTGDFADTFISLGKYLDSMHCYIGESGGKKIYCDKGHIYLDFWIYDISQLIPGADPSWDFYFNNRIEGDAGGAPSHIYENYKNLMLAYKDVVKEVLPQGLDNNLPDYKFGIYSGLDKSSNTIRTKVFVMPVDGYDIYNGVEWVYFDNYFDSNKYVCNFMTENFKTLK